MNRNNSNIEGSLQLIKEPYGDESNIDDLLEGVKLGIANITDPGALRRTHAYYPDMHHIGSRIAHIVARETLKKYNPTRELKTGIEGDSLQLIKEDYGGESNIDDLLEGVKLGIDQITEPDALRRTHAYYPDMHHLGNSIAHIVGRETVKKYYPTLELKTGLVFRPVGSFYGGRTLKRNKRSNKSRKYKSKRK